MIQYYLVGLSLALLLYLSYIWIAGARSDESERRRLEGVELRLANILRLLEAPDVVALLENPKARRSLFFSFSRSLHHDVTELVKMRLLGPLTLALAGIFYLSYYLLWYKTMLHSGRNDIRFLSGLELMIVRRTVSG